MIIDAQEVAVVGDNDRRARENVAVSPGRPGCRYYGLDEQHVGLAHEQAHELEAAALTARISLMRV